MNVLVLSLLLALSAATEEVEVARRPAGAGGSAHQMLPPGTGHPDPCATAREIVRQPACLADGDCRALELWRRSFGAPRLRPLDPGRGGYRPAPGGRGIWRGSGGRPRHRSEAETEALPEGSAPPLAPGFVCPAENEPPG